MEYILRKDVIAAMIFNVGMRNTSFGSVLAISYFPASVAFPIIYIFFINTRLLRSFRTSLMFLIVSIQHELKLYGLQNTA